MKNKVTAVIKQDEGWCIGWGQEIPGVNSQGKTRAELVKNLHSALRDALELNRGEAIAAAKVNSSNVEPPPVAALARRRRLPS